MIRKTIKNFFHKLSDGKKSIIKISSGTIFGQIIAFVTLPIITRIYGAEIIGIWAIIYALVVIVNSFSDFGLTYTIMDEEDNNVEIAYSVISTLSLAVSVVSSIIVTMCYKSILPNISVNYIGIFVLFIITSFTHQQIQICYTWLNRKGDYNTLMKNPILHNSIFGTLAILFGGLKFGLYGYIAARLIGLLVTLLNMKRKLPTHFFSFNKDYYKTIFRRNIRYVKYQLPTNIIGKLKINAPIFLINSLWSANLVGYYDIVVKLLNIPSTLLASSIGRVFFQKISDLRREGVNFGNFVYRNLLKATKIAALPTIVLIALGDFLIVFLLGNDWELAGSFVRIMALQNIFIFLVTASTGLAITLKKQHFTLYAYISQIIFMVISHLVGKYFFNSINIALIIMTTAQIVINVIYFCFLFKDMEISWKNYLKKTIGLIMFVLLVSFITRAIYLTIIY